MPLPYGALVLCIWTYLWPGGYIRRLCELSWGWGRGWVAAVKIERECGLSAQSRLPLSPLPTQHNSHLRLSRGIQGKVPSLSTVDPHGDRHGKLLYNCLTEMCDVDLSVTCWGGGCTYMLGPASVVGPANMYFLIINIQYSFQYNFSSSVGVFVKVDFTHVIIQLDIILRATKISMLFRCMMTYYFLE